MSGDMYLTLWTAPNGSSMSVAVDRRRAFSMTEDEFVDLYLGTVLSPISRRQRKRDARAWARAQIAKREAVLAAASPSPETDEA